MSIYYVQECPTCGRSLQIRVAYLGRKVVCQHCNRNFEATDPATNRVPAEQSGIDMLRRADELLQSYAQQRQAGA